MIGMDGTRGVTSLVVALGSEADSLDDDTGDTVRV